MVKNGDIFGDGVNIATRLEALADIGGMCVTRGVRDRVEAKFDDMGTQCQEHRPSGPRAHGLFHANYEPVLAAMKPREGQSKDVSLDSDDDLTEATLWESIREDDDGTELQLCLKRYPEGTFSDLALARVDRDLTPAEDPAVEVSRTH